MKKLTKAQIKALTGHQTAVSNAQGAVTDAVEAFNLRRRELWADVKAAVEAYNAGVTEAWEPVADAVVAADEVFSEAEDFLEEVVDHMEEYVNSDRLSYAAHTNYHDWVEAYRSAKDALQDTSMAVAPEDLDLNEPEDMPIPEGAAEAMDELTHAPEPV